MRKGFLRAHVRAWERRKKRYLDLGANIGTFSIKTASRGYKVIAFEPDTENCEILKQNVALNHLESRIQVEQKAIHASREK